jgi:hypothetical protein
MLDAADERSIVLAVYAAACMAIVCAFVSLLASAGLLVQMWRFYSSRPPGKEMWKLSVVAQAFTFVTCAMWLLGVRLMLHKDLKATLSVSWPLMLVAWMINHSLIKGKTFD